MLKQVNNIQGGDLCPQGEKRESETGEHAQVSGGMGTGFFFCLCFVYLCLLVFNLIATLYVPIGYLFIYLEIGSHYIAPALLELKIILPQPPKC